MNTIKKLLMYSVAGVGFSSSIDAMESVLQKNEVVIVLADGEVSIAQEEWKAIEDLLQRPYKDDFKALDEAFGCVTTQVYLPDLTKKTLAELREKVKRGTSSASKDGVLQADIIIELADGEVSIPRAEWNIIEGLQGGVFKDFAALDEALGAKTTKMVFSSLTKDGLAVLRKHLTLIQEGGKSLEDLFDSLINHNQAEEYITLLIAGDYLAIESIVTAFYAVLDARIAQYLWQAMMRYKEKWNDAFAFASKKLAERIVLCAAGKGNAEIVALFLEDGVIDINAKDPSGMTCLMHASRKGHKHIVELLLPYKPDSICRNHLGMTALMEASMAGWTEIVELLLKHGAQGDIDQKSLFGFTALMYASERGHTKIVELLLEYGASCNLVAGVCSTALNFAVLRDHKEIIALLQAKGAQLGIVPADRELAPEW